MTLQIVGDLSCVGCGYNLRTLEEAGVCPECGLGVGRSMAGDQLERAEGRWLGKVRRGLLLEAIASVLIVGYGGAQVLELGQGGKVDVIITVGVLAAFGVLTVMAGWYLTAEEPGRRRRISKWALRAGSVVVAVAFAGQGLDMAQQAVWPGRVPGAMGAFWNAHIDWLFMAFPVRFGAEAFLLVMLARRMRARHLGWQARLLGWAFSFVAGVATVGGPAEELVKSDNVRGVMEQGIEYCNNISLGMYAWVVAVLILFYVRVGKSQKAHP